MRRTKTETGIPVWDVRRAYFRSVSRLRRETQKDSVEQFSRGEYFFKFTYFRVKTRENIFYWRFLKIFSGNHAKILYSFFIFIPRIHSLEDRPYKSSLYKIGRIKVSFHSTTFKSFLVACSVVYKKSGKSETPTFGRPYWSTVGRIEEPTHWCVACGAE